MIRAYKNVNCYIRMSRVSPGKAKIFKGLKVYKMYYVKLEKVNKHNRYRKCK